MHGDDLRGRRGLRVRGLRRHDEVNNWRYQLAKENGGTRITESFELETSGFSKVYWRLLGWHRSRANERGMTQTLERVRTIAEQS